MARLPITKSAEQITIKFYIYIFIIINIQFIRLDFKDVIIEANCIQNDNF